MPRGKQPVSPLVGQVQTVRYNYGSLDVPGQRILEGYRQEGRKRLIALGGVRGGKSWYEARVAIDWALKLGGLGWITIPEYSYASELVRLINSVLYQNPEVIIEAREHPFPRWKLRAPGAPEIEIRSAYDPDAIRASTLTWGIMDEAARQSKWAYLNMEERLLSTGGPLLLGTTPKGKNWLYDLYMKFKAGDSTYGVALLKSKDNPHIPVDALKNLQEQWAGDSQYARQELEAEFVTFEGLVYSAFDTDKHVIAPGSVPQIPRLLLAIDWGSADPLAILVMGRHEGVWYIVDEFYQSHVSLDELAKIIQGFRNTYPTIQKGWLSWERPEIAQFLRGRGLSIYCATKEDVSEGIATIDSLIRDDKLMVSRICSNTLMEFGLYQYRQFKTGERKPGEKPLDRDNHSLDAMRQVIRSEMGSTSVKRGTPYVYKPESNTTGY